MQTIKRFAMVWFLLIFLAASTMSAAVGKKGYKCVDDSGRIEYRELAVDDMACTLLRPVAKSSTDPDAEMEKLREQVETSTQTAAVDSNEQRAKNCERARVNADVLGGDRDVIQTTAEGQKVVLDKQAREQALAQTRKDIDYWCDN
jgi:hypothetical protein